MKKQIILTILLLTAGFYNVFGQAVGIGTQTPHASSMLEVESTTKGFLPPRMTEAQRDAITSPAEGLVIYNITEKCINFYNNSGWASLCEEASPFDPESSITGFTLDCNAGARVPHISGNETYWLEKGVNTASRPVTYTIPYTATGTAIGIQYPEMILTSTGAGSNLRAKLIANTTIANGKLTFILDEGTPSTGGEYTFEFVFGGQTCSFTLATCGAYIAAGVWKEFMCHNLGANYNLDPHVAVAEIHGAKYKFGTKSPALSRINDQSNLNAIPGWTSITPPGNDTSWNAGTETNPVKNIANDPCPVGYRIPTWNEWKGVADNNPIHRNLQSSTERIYTNYVLLGKGLFLPGTHGWRWPDDGHWKILGSARAGWYLSSTPVSTGNDDIKVFHPSPYLYPMEHRSRTGGMDVRCIAE